MSDTLTAARPQGARLTLRSLAPADAPRIAALAGDFEVARMTAAIPHPYGVEDAEAFIEAARRGGACPSAAFALELPGEGLIGVIGFRAGEGLGPELGYWIGRAFWGRGLATEAARAALAWARAAWGVRSATAGVFIDNPASMAVLTKAGFLPTGRTQSSFCAARGAAVPSRRMIWLA